MKLSLFDEYYLCKKVHISAILDSIFSTENLYYRSTVLGVLKVE